LMKQCSATSSISSSSMYLPSFFPSPAATSFFPSSPSFSLVFLAATSSLAEGFFLMDCGALTSFSKSSS
jgi:hypothetical protein